MKWASPRPFAVFTSVTSMAALALVVYSFQGYQVPLSVHLVLMLVASVVAEALAVKLPRGGSQSMAYPLSLASIILFGPTGALLVSAASAISIQDLRDRTPPSLLVFNLSQILVSTTLSAYVYLRMGGLILLQVDGVAVRVYPLSSADFPQAVVPLLLLALSSFLSNAILASAATAFYRGVSLRSVWNQNIAWLAPAQVSLAFLGYAIADVVAVSPIGFVLFIFPLVVSRQVFQGYLSLLSTYLDTVRALVATIEAKDKYTIGHSERVATYAVALARGMNMNEQQQAAVEYCALLHDLGKVGIDSKVLNKPGPLSPAEFSLIREHPRTGASIASRVPLLRDIADIIGAHHERFDGEGYCLGLSGESIPIEARVLAVADTFDAMTSVRAYREPCTAQAALREIRRNSGTQFDPDVVAVAEVLEDAFVPSSSGGEMAS